MQTYPQIGVVIPARHEEHNLPHVLPHIPHFVREVMSVDGHATDSAIGVARQVYPIIRILVHIFREGWCVIQNVLKEKYTPLTHTSCAMIIMNC
jgi:hypothetical protein